MPDSLAGDIDIDRDGIVTPDSCCALEFHAQHAAVTARVRADANAARLAQSVRTSGKKPRRGGAFYLQAFNGAVCV
ncbi:MAG TPA: hypothetical protein VLT92_19180 [Burkholderiales bacterium]|nr:hypothetical protein [Burkholderiales bacterium]